MAIKLSPRIIAFAITVIAMNGTAVSAQGRITDSLTVVVSPGLVNFVLKPNGISTESAPVAITTDWQIQRGGTQVSVYAYFSNSAAALSSVSGGKIPSSRVFGKKAGGAFTPFAGGGSLSAGGSFLIFAEKVKGNKRVMRTDTLELQIDTTGLNLTPSVYTGVLQIQAQAL